MIEIKAKIYRLTGIYLLEKEEAEYVSSQEFQKEFEEKKVVLGEFMSDENIKSLMIGMWQSKHRICRRMHDSYLSDNKLYRIYGWIYLFFLELLFPND